MPVPTINTTQSVLALRLGVPFEFQAYATEAPFYWEAAGLPSGLSIDTPAAKNATIEADDDIVSCTAHGYLDGDRVYFTALAGGTGLSTNTIYYVRDKTTDGFKVAASPAGAAINITVDYSSATVRKVSSGKISGTPTASGVSVVGLKATNATGTSTEQVFTFGVEAAATGAGDPNLSDGSVGVTIDLTSRQVTLPADGLWVKYRDGLILNVHFTKDGAPAAPDITALGFRLKDLEGDASLVEATLFRSAPDSSPEYWQIYVEFVGDALQAAVADYEGEPLNADTDPEKITGFVGVAEIEWIEAIAGWSGGPTSVRGTSRSFPVNFIRDLGETAAP